MISMLYDCFKKWSVGGSIYIISDPHFRDSNITVMNAKWISPEEHIKKIKQKVHKNDTLICLGDCGDLDYIKQLKGYKVLIKGNHDDRGDSYYKKKIEKKIYDADEYSPNIIYNELKEKYPYSNISITETWDTMHSPFHRFVATIDNNLFDEVYSGPLFIAPKILLSHEPITGMHFCMNIHGHVHNGKQVWTDNKNGKHINLASDVSEWEVFNLGEAIKEGLVAKIDDVHRVTIDKAIEKKSK